VEVLIASFGVALGLAGMLVSFSALMRTARLVDQENQALHQARERLETLRTYPYTAPQLAVGTHAVAGGQYVVSTYTYPSTKRVVLSYDVVAPNNVTSQVSVTTVLTAGLHK